MLDLYITCTVSLLINSAITSVKYIIELDNYFKIII